MGFRGSHDAYISDMGAGERKIVCAQAQKSLLNEPYDFCGRASMRLMDNLLTDGFSARILRCNGLKTEALDADARWIKLSPQSSWVHYVVKVGEDVVDLTRRQFFPASGYPFVQSYAACKAEWDKLDVLE